MSLRLPRPLVVAIVLAAVPAVSWAQDAPAALEGVTRTRFARAVALAPQTPQTASEWTAQLDAAKARRSAARKEAFAGFGFAIGGAILMQVSLRDSVGCYVNCRSHPLLFWGGFGTAIGGLVGSISGSIKAHDADGEVNALISRGPGKVAALALLAGPGGAITVDVGRDVAIGYRVTW